jgi:hypothetical protein
MSRVTATAAGIAGAGEGAARAVVRVKIAAGATAVEVETALVIPVRVNGKLNPASLSESLNCLSSIDVDEIFVEQISHVLEAIVLFHGAALCSLLNFLQLHGLAVLHMLPAHHRLIDNIGRFTQFLTAFRMTTVEKHQVKWNAASTSVSCHVA